MGIGVFRGLGAQRRAAVESRDKRLPEGKSKAGMLLLCWALALLMGLGFPALLRAGVALHEEYECAVDGRTVQRNAVAHGADAAKYPWMVALFQDGSFACNGVQLGEEWVLTAGQCVAGVSAERLVAGYGEGDLLDLGTAERVPVREVLVHPDYHPAATAKNDIALLRLRTRGRGNSYAYLPLEGETAPLERPGTCAVVPGWPTDGRFEKGISRPLMASHGSICTSEGADQGEICLSAAGDAARVPGAAVVVGGLPNRPLWLLGIVRPGSGASEGNSVQRAPLDTRRAVFDSVSRVSHYREWIDTARFGPQSVPVAISRMEFVRIPAGSFVMGSPEGEEGRDDYERQHEVTISQGFYIGKYEVTQGEWEAVMGRNHSDFKACGSRCPVENVSWDEVQEFIGRLNDLGSESGYAYRLPTEAEWEYAARAGTVGATPEGELRILGESNAPVLDGQAWYGGNSGVSYEGGFDCSDWGERQYESELCGTHPVGQKRANGWGLHDMLGNVWEWTADWDGAYPGGPVTDPTGPSMGSRRVVRGGGWHTHARYVRSAYRSLYSPGSRYAGIGFRLVRTD